MATMSQTPVTQLLSAVKAGELGAHDRLWSLIYDELHRLAQHQMAAEAPGRTLQPTALVHEAYFRLFGDNQMPWSNRAHFFTAAAEAMRRIRIDDARRRGRLKRGGGQRPASMTDEPAVFDQDPVEVIAIDEALGELEALAPRQTRVVKLRYFAGLTIEECAAVLEIAPRTVDNDWALARAWLHRKLIEDDDSQSETDGHDR